jgi:hypothetical protein
MTEEERTSRQTGHMHAGNMDKQDIQAGKKQGRTMPSQIYRHSLPTKPTKFRDIFN